MATIKSMNVHHITPGRADKDLGRATNDLIRGLPADDWICLRDIDTMPLHHRVFFKQCEDIARDGTFQLVSCMTNRLGLTYQLHGGKASDNWDMKHHYEIALDRFIEYGSEVSEIPRPFIAGVMMLFPVWLWMEVGEFPEGGIQIKGKFLDYIFSDAVRQLGHRVGVAKGIYLFHSYRNWGESTRMNVGHLY